MRTRSLILSVAFVAGMLSPALAQRSVDPDWPCPQRRVPTLSAGQVWDGPPIDNVKDWDKDAEIRTLITTLASRRIPQDEAVKALKDYAGKLSAAERDGKLTELFAGLLSTVNAERSTVIKGIIRFEQRQSARSRELEREGTRLGELRKTASDDKARTELENAQQLFDWNVRVFQERQSNTPIACEIPVLMESRIFEIAREIRQLMSK